MESILNNHSDKVVEVFNPKQHSGKPRIVYLISHGHTARGLLQTGLLKKLSENGLDITVISKEGKNTVLDAYCADVGATHIQYAPPLRKTSVYEEWLRIYILEDVRKNPALWEKHLRRINGGQGKGLRIFMAHFFLLLSRISNKFPFIKKWFINYERKRFKDPAADAILAQIKPQLVISTRPIDHMEVSLLGAARRLGVKRLLATLSWDNITSKGIFSEIAEKYISWGPIMTEEIVAYYNIDRQNITECGVAHFDLHIQTKHDLQANQYLAKLGLSPDKPYIFFTMSAAYFCPDEIDIVEWIAKKTKENYFGDDMQFIARPHMQSVKGQSADPTWIGRLKAIISDRVAVDFPDMADSELTWSMKQDDMQKMSNLLNGASVTLNSCSTVAIEAAIVDKPIIMPLFDVHPDYPEWKSVHRSKDFIHMRKFLSFNAVSIAGSFEELGNEIRQYIRTPGIRAAERKQVAIEECFRLDGKSTGRVADEIARIAFEEYKASGANVNA